MKLLFLLSFSLFAFIGASFGQSATIESVTETIKRPKPTSEYKQSFTIVRPKIKGSPLTSEIEKTISYESVMELSVDEEKTDFQWLEEATYEVNHNDNFILNLTLNMSGSAAYPSLYSKTVTVDLKTGKRLRSADLFTDLEALAKSIKVLQDKEIAEAKKELTEDEKDIGEYFDNAKFTVEELDEFMINADGISFVHDYGFPHVIKALEPNGVFKITWADLKPYIKKDGLLAQFVR